MVLGEPAIKVSSDSLGDAHKSPPKLVRSLYILGIMQIYDIRLGRFDGSRVSAKFRACNSSSRTPSSYATQDLMTNSHSSRIADAEDIAGA